MFSNANKGLQAARSEWSSEDKKDVVILHAHARHEKCPAISPFGLKLETFLRMHNIKYHLETEYPFHPDTGKTPWITYNGEDVADSQMIIEYLTDKLELKTELKDDDEKVLVRGIRSVMEDNYFFCRMADMFVFGDAKDLDFMPTFSPVNAFNKIITNRAVGAIAKQPIEQGIGKHNKETVIKIAQDDLATVSLALGAKPYLLGNEPSDIDAVIFGFLAVTLNVSSANHEMPKLLEKFDNLKAHTERIKDQFWNDWEELCQKAKEAKEAKAAGKKKTKSPKKDPEAKAAENGDEAAGGEGNDKKDDATTGNGDANQEAKKEEEEGKPDVVDKEAAEDDK